MTNVLVCVVCSLSEVLDDARERVAPGVRMSFHGSESLGQLTVLRCG